ncbi:MAG: MarR family transcriptional regulator, partial [Gammaproteobacteria bacterium]|nr:MarR family transcriptional regulator [Gammaproteobacteria bacterium]
MKPFETSLPMMLYRTLDAVMPAFRVIFTQFDLTEQQWRVLRVLWEQDAKPLLALAEATLIQAPSLVGIVDRLQRNGLVERRRSELDRRVVRVCLTASGKALEAQVTPLVDAAYSDLEGLVTVSEWTALLQTLAKIAGRAKSGCRVWHWCRGTP